MQKLLVENFSCIKHAEISFSRLTLIIGPQASGKSVLCKLAYFFMDAARSQEIFIPKGYEHSKFQAHFKQQFLEWFPPDAWGSDGFKIEFCAGSYKVTINRVVYGKKLKADIRVRFSPEFKEQYASLLLLAKESPAKSTDADGDLRASWEFEWKLRQTSQKSLSILMGGDYYSDQIFVPAGRSFFTSLDKAISIFEHARTIDPFIMRFGKLYNLYRERLIIGDPAHNKPHRDALKKRLEEIFGGILEKDNDVDYIRTTDGRKVKLSALSSGQQELFPLLITIPILATRQQSLCFIEEPEAHLFPKSQSLLVEALTLLIPGTLKPNGLVLTTHSPYVLAKINNLIKAGTLGRRNTDLARRVEAIVPRRFWLSGRQVRAYSIDDGVVKSIMDAGNFINADYLDEISNDIAEEFGNLLELEAVYD